MFPLLMLRLPRAQSHNLVLYSLILWGAHARANVYSHTYQVLWPVRGIFDNTTIVLYSIDIFPLSIGDKAVIKKGLLSGTYQTLKFWLIFRRGVKDLC